MKRLLERLLWKSIKRVFVSSLLVGTIIAGLAAPALADDPAIKGMLFFNGSIVRTVIVPAPLPHGGQDPFFEVTHGAAGQLGIAGVAPGSADYHGGAWAVSRVTWNVTPYLLTSAQAVATASAKGDVSVTRRSDLDFRCPVQP